MSEIMEAWIAVRTPLGKHGGTLAMVRPDDLGALALDELAERAGVSPEVVEDVYMGRACLCSWVNSRVPGC
jgi:acetyl-CoA acyltransferase